MTVDKPLKTDSLASTWQGISAAMKAEVSTDTFNRWFKDIDLVELDRQKLTLRVPNNIYQLWIESNYLGMLRTAVLMELGSEREIRFALADPTGETAPPSSPMPMAPPVTDDDLEPVVHGRGGSSAVMGGMNPRNTFECFVVGANNEYAHAACLAVSNSPGKTYNPLFIYGGVGLGKTHLMQAIGQAALNKKRTSKVVYLTSETFTNEFIDAIQKQHAGQIPQTLPAGRRAAHRRHPVPRRQGPDSGGILPHLQHPLRRPQTNRPLKRPPTE